MSGSCVRYIIPFCEWKMAVCSRTFFFGKILESIEGEGSTIKPLKHNELPHNLQENALAIQTGPASLLFAIPPANQQTTASSLWKQHIVVQEPHLSVFEATYMFQVVVHDFRTFQNILKLPRACPTIFQLSVLPLVFEAFSTHGGMFVAALITNISHLPINWHCMR